MITKISVPLPQDVNSAQSLDEPVLQPLAEFQQEFRAALAQAGYDTPEKIIDLVRQVKRELAAEAERRCSCQPAQCS